MEAIAASVYFRVAGVTVGFRLEILNEVCSYLVFTRSCSVFCDATRARYGTQCSIRLPSVRAHIPEECGIRSQPVRLPVRLQVLLLVRLQVRLQVGCSAGTSAAYELALDSSCYIWLPNFPTTCSFDFHPVTVLSTQNTNSSDVLWHNKFLYGGSSMSTRMMLRFQR